MKQSNFKSAFSYYRFIHIRDLSPSGALNQTYIALTKAFNQASSALEGGDEVTALTILSDIAQNSIFQQKVLIATTGRDTEDVLADVACALLGKADVDCPYLLTLGDKDCLENVTGYRAEYHLETRKQPELSGTFLSSPLAHVPVAEPLFPDAFLFDPWSLDKFSKSPEDIPHIGFADPQSFSLKCDARFFNMPIRLAGENHIVIPSELAHVSSLINEMANHAFSLTKQYQKTHPECIDRFLYYLTFDQRMVEKGQKHRGPNPHSDDLQGPRYATGKLTAGWEYLVSDLQPTTFYKQSFDLNGLDENAEDLWAGLEAQADESKTYCLKPYEIGCMTFYDIHRGSVMESSGLRTFAKLAVTEKIFDADGDTINPGLVGEEIGAITYPWRYTTRKVPPFVGLERYKR